MSMNRSPQSRPRVALIGALGYAKIYIDFLLPAHDAGRLALAAAAVIPEHQGLPVADELRNRGTRLYGDWQEMLKAHAGQLDLCFIPTGIQWHARMAIEALRAGANVLVEKPLTGSVEDALAVQAAERETGRWVAVGFQDIYADVNLALKAELIGGRIGKLKSISMLGLWPRPHSYYTRNHWAGRLIIDGAAAMDSPLNNAFAHFINLSLFLAGSRLRDSVEAEVVSVETFRAHEIESFDTAVVRARSTDGVDFWFGVTHACRDTLEPEISIKGESGTAEWYHERYCILRPDGAEPIRLDIPGTGAVRLSMFEAVLAKLDDPTVPVCDTELACHHTAFIERVHAKASIETLAPEMVDIYGGNDGNGPNSAISGVEDALKRAFREQKTLAEVGFEPSFLRSS